MDIFKFTCYAWYFFTTCMISLFFINFKNLDENGKYIRKWQVGVAMTVVPPTMWYFLFFKEGLATMLGVGMMALIIYSDMTAPRRRR